MTLFGSDIEKFDIGGNPQVNGKPVNGTIHWMATRNKYFCALIIPTDAKGTGIQLSGMNIPEEAEIGQKNYISTLEMKYTSRRSFSNSFLVYMGPVDYYTFKEITKTIGQDLKLADILDINSFIKPLSMVIYRIFNFLHGFIPNYGFVIIIFSLLINMLMYPLTAKSYKSMKKMQELQPLMNELKNKYKDEPQKLQQAQIKMYKELKINPVGGCLPMLLQMPVFFAIYPIFRTIELRGAPFILWIKDLAVPDTVATLPFSLPAYGDQVNVLTFVYAITMFIQQKITMKDPKQKMMIYIMPVVLLFVLNRLSSGFILYFIIFFLLSIGQRFLVRDGSDAETASAISEMKKKITAKKGPKKSRNA